MQPMKLHHINLQIRRTGTQAETSWSSVSIRLNTELSRLSMHANKLSIAILRNVKRVQRITHSKTTKTTQTNKTTKPARPEGFATRNKRRTKQSEQKPNRNQTGTNKQPGTHETNPNQTTACDTTRSANEVGGVGSVNGLRVSGVEVAG